MESNRNGAAEKTAAQQARCAAFHGTTVMLQTEVLEARVDFGLQPFARPLQLSSGIIRELTQATAEVRVRVEGREAAGRGSIYLSDLWAWPDPGLPHARRDAA